MLLAYACFPQYTLVYYITHGALLLLCDILPQTSEVTYDRNVVQTEMFNKKPRRNFRQRKQSSSEDEDQQKNGGEGDEPEEAPSVINKPPKAAQSRGISCSSKREATPPQADSSDGEAAAEALEATEDRDDKDGTKTTKSSILSFTDDKEGS